MKKRIAAVITLTAFVIGISGCATVPDEHRGAATGAGIGAATGVLAGAVLAGEGSRTKGAIIGGLAGALLGGVIGNYTVDRKKSAQETSKTYSYAPSSGIIVRIETATAKPAVIYPGETANLEVTYAVMSPSGASQVALTESREVTFNGELVGNPEVSVNQTAGTFHSSVPLMLPTDAKKGKYRVITTIRTATSKDSKESSFLVQ